MFEKLDLFILDGIFQKIADWVNDRWGKSCFWIARISCWTVVIAWAAEVVFYRERLSWNTALFVIWSFFALLNIRDLEKRDEKFNLVAERVLNPQRMFYYWGIARIIFAVWLYPFTLLYFLTFIVSGEGK